MQEGRPPTDVLDTAEAGGIVVRGGMVRAIGFVAGTLVSLAGVVVLTRHLGVVRYGRYQTVVSLVTVVSSITDLGMAAYGVREYTQRTGEDREHLMSLLLGLRLVSTTVGVLIGAAVAALAYSGGQLVLGVVLMGAGVIALILQDTLQIPLAAELRLGTLTAIDLVRQTLGTILIVVLVLANAGLVPFFATTIPVHLLLLAWTAALVRGRMPLRPSVRPREWLALVRPTLAFALAVAVGTIYVYTAQVLTSLVAGDHQTGLFSAPFRVFIILAAVPGLLVNAAFPLISRAAQREDWPRLANAVGGLFAGTLLLGGAAALGCILGAKAIIDVIAGAKYAGSVPVLRIQGVALLLTYVISTFGFTLLALHRHRAMIVVNALSFATSAVTVSILASSHGARGAAFGTVLGELVLATGYVVALTRVRPELRPRPIVIARVLVAFGGGLATLAIPDLPSVARAALGLAIYAVLALVLRAVPDDVLVQAPWRR